MESLRNIYVKVFAALEYLKLIERTPSLTLIGNLRKLVTTTELAGGNVIEQISGYLGIAVQSLIRLQDPFEHAFKLRVVTKINNLEDDDIKEQLLNFKDDEPYGHPLYKEGFISGGRLLTTVYNPSAVSTGSWPFIDRLLEDPSEIQRAQLSIKDFDLKHIYMLETSDGIAVLNVRNVDSIEFFVEFCDAIKKDEIKLKPQTPFLINSNLCLPERNYSYEISNRDRIVNCFKILSQKIRSYNIWISVANEELSALENQREPNNNSILNRAEVEKHALSFATRYNVNILYHDRDGAGLAHFSESDQKYVWFWQSTPMSREKKVEFHTLFLEGSANVLNSAFTLALSIRKRLISQDSGSDKDVGWIQSQYHTDLKAYAGLKLDFEECLAFAQTIATARLLFLEEMWNKHKNFSAPPDRYKIFHLIPKQQEDEPQANTMLSGEIFKTFSLGHLKKFYDNCRVPTGSELIAMLLEAVRNDGTDAIIRLVSFSILRYFYINHKLTIGPIEERKIILWDLDRTLIPSIDNYHHSMRMALQQLSIIKSEHNKRGLEDRKKLQDDCDKLADKIYDLSGKFEEQDWIDGSKIKNMKRVWNCEEFYYVFLAIFISEDIKKTIMADKAGSINDSMITQIAQKALEWRRALLHTDEVRAAVDAFKKTRVRLFDHAIETLLSLHLLGIRQYIVTEGDDENQLWKWQNSDLADAIIILDDKKKMPLIPVQNVLTSYRAGSGALNLLDIKILIKEEKAKLHGAGHSLSMMGEGQGVTVLTEIQKFVEHLMDKNYGDFYVIVLKAVAMFPMRARDMLRLVRVHPSKEFAKSMKGFMIGDTYEKDIKPFIRMHANIGTILTAIDKDRFDKQEIDDKLKPDMIGPTLPIVLDYLSKESTWQSKVSPINWDNVHFQPVKDIQEITDGLLYARKKYQVFGIKRIIDEFFQRSADFKGCINIENILLEIAQTNSDDIVRISALETLEILPVRWMNTGTEEKVVNCLKGIFDGLNMTIDSNKRILLQVIKTAGMIGGKATFDWLIDCFNADAAIAKLKNDPQYFDSAILACEKMYDRITRCEDCLVKSRKTKKTIKTKSQKKRATP